MDKESTIVVWSDCDWCWESDLYEYTWKSDDYTKVEWLSEEEPTESQIESILDGTFKTDKET